MPTNNLGQSDIATHTTISELKKSTTENGLFTTENMSFFTKHAILMRREVIGQKL
jgi:hypothetical protein